MFDMNRDGVLDPAEQAFQLDFITGQMEEEERSEDDEFDLDEIDLEELEFMDEDDRREALEEAGYDPDDFEADF